MVRWILFGLACFLALVWTMEYLEHRTQSRDEE